MRHDVETYTNFDRFCFTITRNVEQVISKSQTTERILRVVGLIALIFFHIGVAAFLALCALLFAGFVAYYGGIAALFAAHPIFASILIMIMGAAGFGMAKSVREMYKNKEVFAVVKDRVVSAYRDRFQASLRNTHSSASYVKPEHEQRVNQWVSQATVEVLAALIKRTEVGASDILTAALWPLIGVDVEEGAEAFTSALGPDARELLRKLFNR